MAHEAWSRDEVEAAVADYFHMLQWELSGIAYNKADRNERLRALVHRSRGSIEFKHANVSAILTLYGYPYIDGYKPRGNFQAPLEQVVLELIDAHRDFFDPVLCENSAGAESSKTWVPTPSRKLVPGDPRPLFDGPPYPISHRLNRGEGRRCAVLFGARRAVSR